MVERENVLNNAGYIIFTFEYILKNKKIVEIFQLFYTNIMKKRYNTRFEPGFKSYSLDTVDY